MKRFASYHPFTVAIYFLSIFVIVMFSANPVFLSASLVGGILFFIKAQPHIKFLKEFTAYFILFALVSLTNPLFSHRGVTVLFFLNANPVTLEALLYGVNASIMIIAVMQWFKCFNLVMTDDKLLHLFGKISPKTALIISSALRFVPLFKAQAKKIKESQRAMGMFSSDAWLDKIKSTMRVYSVLITWALENAVDTGISMKARGYGLKGRSHFSIFSFGKADALLLITVAFLDAYIFAVSSTGLLDFTFYPKVSFNSPNVFGVTAFLGFFVLCLIPFIIEVKEDLRWKYYKSKI